VCTRRLSEDRHALGRRWHVAAPGLLVIGLLATAAGANAIVVKDNLFGVKAMSASEAWAVGTFGSIYHTADAGKSWQARESGTKVPLFAVDFADAEHGWIVGRSSTILATTDGGRTWKAQKSVIPTEKHLFNLKAVDAQTVWAVGDWGAITTTGDGGVTWEDRSLGEDVILNAVSFLDAQHGYIVGEFGTLRVTSDGGKTWEKREVGTQKTLFGVSFATPEKGWVVGIDGLILRTRDGGKTWDVQHGTTEAASVEELSFVEMLKNPGLYDVSVIGQYGVVVGDTGNVMTTSDGGETWTQCELPEKKRLVWMHSVSLLPGGSQGFTVGAGGFLAALDHGQVVLPGDERRAAAER
jgi:photosystem II stability/assembly factor-like uncharacterized protein